MSKDLQESTAGPIKQPEADFIFCKNCNRIQAIDDSRCDGCGERICTFCGCTDSAACLGGCSWVRDGVCSACD